jgi:hypothetical protein
MKFHEIVGKQADVDLVARGLAELGFSGQVNIPRDETDVYLNFEARGISLLFQDERYIGQKHEIEFPSDAPVLTAIFLYGPGDNEFREYQGDLPGGLKLSDDQERAQAELGPAVKFNEARGLEIWELGNKVRLFVLYAEGLRSIARVQFGILWK